MKRSTASRIRVCKLDLDRTHSQHNPVLESSPKQTERNVSTSGVVASADLLDVHAAQSGGTLLRNLPDGFLRGLFVRIFCSALLHAAQVFCAQLAFMEKSVAGQAVAGVALLTVQNVSVIFGEECALKLLSAHELLKLIRHTTYPSRKWRLGRRGTLLPLACISWPHHRCIYLAGQ